MSLKKRSKSSIETSDDDKIFKCERILKMRYNSKLNRREYLLKWLGYSISESTWEPKENIIDTKLLDDFKQTIQNSIKNIKPAQALKFDQEIFDTEKAKAAEEVKKQALKIKSIVKPTEKESVKFRSKSSEKPMKEQSLKKIKLKSKQPSLSSLKNIDIPSLCPIPKPMSSIKYANGLEPKILKDFIDSRTGELMFVIRWRNCSQNETKTADLIIEKYPEVVERYNPKFIIQAKKQSEPIDCSMNEISQELSDPVLMDVDEQVKQPEIVAAIEEEKNDTELEPEIIGLFLEDGEKKFQIKRRNKEENEFILAKIANCEFPQLVIKFYEENIFLQKS